MRHKPNVLVVSAQPRFCWCPVQALINPTSDHEMGRWPCCCQRSGRVCRSPARRFAAALWRRSGGNYHRLAQPRLAYGHHRQCHGCAGVTVLDDSRGGEDIYGRTLQATLVSRADALAGAATLVMGETTEKLPVVILRGLPPEQTLSDDPNQTAQLINRPLDEDTVPLMPRPQKILAITGGVGGAKLALGLSKILTRAGAVCRQRGR